MQPLGQSEEAPSTCLGLQRVTRSSKNLPDPRGGESRRGVRSRVHTFYPHLARDGTSHESLDHFSCHTPPTLGFALLPGRLDRSRRFSCLEMTSSNVPGTSQSQASSRVTSSRLLSALRSPIALLGHVRILPSSPLPSSPPSNVTSTPELSPC